MKGCYTSAVYYTSGGYKAILGSVAEWVQMRNLGRKGYVIRQNADGIVIVDPNVVEIEDR